MSIEKTSGKFALTKAVSCLQNSVTRTNLTYKEDCFVYNVTHIDILTQHMNSNGNSELFFVVLSLSLFVGSSSTYSTFNAFLSFPPSPNDKIAY